MANQVRKVASFAVKMAQVPGEGVRLLHLLKKHKVKLIALATIPESRCCRVELVPEDPDRLLALEERMEWPMSKQKTGFLVQGQNQTGALIPVLAVLARNRINVNAIEAVTTGRSRFGAILWVEDKDVTRAAALLLS